jgi:hypothetical protein
LLDELPVRPSTNSMFLFFWRGGGDVLLTMHLTIILVINQLKCTESCFIISLLYAST